MRRRTSVDGSALAIALCDHLEARIADLRSAIAFVLESTRLRSAEDVFCVSQYWSTIGSSPAADMVRDGETGCWCSVPGRAQVPA
jgi:hypothetical protein